MEYTPDGRSLITTTGERRFKVVARSMKDGYNCARISFVYDQPVTNAMEIGKKWLQLHGAVVVVKRVWLYMTFDPNVLEFEP